MTTIQSLRERIKRQERAMRQVKKLKDVRGTSLDYHGAESPDEGTKEKNVPQIKGTKDKMPGAYPFGDKQHKEYKRSGKRWKDKKRKRDQLRLKGVI